MPPLFDPDVFVLGIAAGVLGLVLLFSLIIAYAYDEATLFVLAAYPLTMVLAVLAARQMGLAPAAFEPMLLMGGTALMTGLHAWLMRSREVRRGGLAVLAMTLLAGMALAGLRSADPSPATVWASSYGFGLMLALAWLYLCLPAWRISGPWKWWLLLGHLGGVGIALVFLSGTVQNSIPFWSAAMLLLSQLPPTYLALVWRSRLLNEGRLRGLAAKVTDPLTGLASPAVLLDQLRPAIGRAQQARHGGALYLVEIQNLAGLVNELGLEAKEKILLEAANRLRRATSDRDTAARISERCFAVLAQDLQDDEQVDSLATRLVVSGLRIESDYLPGVAIQFRIIVSALKEPVLADAGAVQDWLRTLTSHFTAWPDTHRSRSIVRIAEGQVRRSAGAIAVPA